MEKAVKRVLAENCELPCRCDSSRPDSTPMHYTESQAPTSGPRHYTAEATTIEMPLLRHTRNHG